MTPDERMRRIDELLSHVWMVRTFLKHSEEAEEDQELRDVHRTLYDFMLALGQPLRDGDAQQYLRQAKKKWAKLQRGTQQFCEIQPEVSQHMNFQMAVQSLRVAVAEIGALLEEA